VCAHSLVLSTTSPLLLTWPALVVCCSLTFMSTTGSAKVESILAQSGAGMAAHDRVISQVEQEEYE